MNPEKVKKPFYKKWWVWVIAVFIFGSAVSGGEEEATTPKEDVKAQETSAIADEKEDKSKAEEKAKKEVEDKKKAEEEAAKKKAEEEAKKTPQQEMIEKISGLIESKQAFDTGSYIKGDIPKGEYAFIPFDGSGQYFSEEDGAGNIVDNENFDSFGYVYVHESGNLNTQGVLISTNAFKALGVTSAKQIYETINNKTDYKEAAWYKVGVDLPAGQYTLESLGEGYVAIMSGPVGNNDIVDNEIFNGRYAVTVSNGQYLKVSKAIISQ